MSLAFMLAIEGGQSVSADDVLAALGPLGLEHTSWSFPRTDGTWCAIVATELELPAPAAELERVARVLLDRLRHARGYRVAIVGLEAATLLEGRTIDDPALTGVVASEDAWRAAGSPAGFAPFAPGYVWRAPPPGFDWHTSM